MNEVQLKSQTIHEFSKSNSQNYARICYSRGEYIDYFIFTLQTYLRLPIEIKIYKKSLFSRIKAAVNLILDTLNSTKNGSKSSINSAKDLYFSTDITDWYDYGARFYDPQIAIWIAVNTLAST